MTLGWCGPADPAAPTPSPVNLWPAGGPGIVTMPGPRAALSPLSGFAPRGGPFGTSGHPSE